ncbi:pyridoxal phosphate-dependent transferase [Lipomyces oligophaga]|uniref:pyridoxal phosphate-dependent transferase n=1 Tax=Lipomyces oligophaga TaxID=45792 RepID=UPI0034CE9AA6
MLLNEVDFQVYVESTAQFLRLFALHVRLFMDYVSASATFQLIRNLSFFYVAYYLVSHSWRELCARGLIGSVNDLYQYLARSFFRLLMLVPQIKSKVSNELSSAMAQMEAEMTDLGPTVTRHLELPEHGQSSEDVLNEMRQLSLLKHSAWEDGKVSGAVYHGGEEILRLQTEAYGMYTVANQLHPDVFPAVRKMDAEVVSMVLRLFNAPETGVGCSTSGGTESLLMTCLSAKMKAYRERGVTEPEIIAPVTIHAGFDKAAYYFGIKLRHAKLDPKTYQVDLKSVRRLINSNTVLIAGSAPNFPHGIIDDIDGLSKIALKYKIPLHVDACLGSFVVPYLERVYAADPDPAVSKIPRFDFRVPGVTSISCDTHKYGFAPKGSSVILYRDSTYRKNQYFLATQWSGGIYASPTLAGSRPGALMAGCWATMMHVGDDGYYASAKSIVATARRIKEAIRTEIPEIYVIGEPLSSVVSFSSEQLNIYALADALSSKGWHLSALQNPPALHIACTRLTTAGADNELIKCLKDSVATVKAAGKAKAKGDTAALYGVAGSVSTRGLVDELAVGFLDILYKA